MHKRRRPSGPENAGVPLIRVSPLDHITGCIPLLVPPSPPEHSIAGVYPPVPVQGTLYLPLKA